MIAPSTSSPSDQLALIGDRVECLQELSEVVTAPNGVSISDKMRFFCGDKPAQQFERGTQIGGTYKCGGCGCKDNMMQDLAHALQCHPRSLQDLQSLILAGQYGNQPGQLKPLDKLLVVSLREGLTVRGYETADMLKPDMQAQLTAELKGAQRVPTLLVLDPTQSLEKLHLQRISPYLEHGEGAWWKAVDDGYRFLDSDNDPANQSCGPTLMHFRNTSV